MKSPRRCSAPWKSIHTAALRSRSARICRRAAFGENWVNTRSKRSLDLASPIDCWALAKAWNRKGRAFTDEHLIVDTGPALVEPAQELRGEPAQETAAQGEGEHGGGVRPTPVHQLRLPAGQGAGQPQGQAVSSRCTNPTSKPGGHSAQGSQQRPGSHRGPQPPLPRPLRDGLVAGLPSPAGGPRAWVRR